MLTLVLQLDNNFPVRVPIRVPRGMHPGDNERRRRRITRSRRPPPSLARGRRRDDDLDEEFGVEDVEAEGARRVEGENLGRRGGGGGRRRRRRGKGEGGGRTAGRAGGRAGPRGRFGSRWCGDEDFEFHRRQDKEVVLAVVAVHRGSVIRGDGELPHPHGVVLEDYHAPDESIVDDDGRRRRRRGEEGGGGGRGGCFGKDYGQRACKTDYEDAQGNVEGQRLDKYA